MSAPDSYDANVDCDDVRRRLLYYLSLAEPLPPHREHFVGFYDNQQEFTDPFKRAD